MIRLYSNCESFRDETKYKTTICGVGLRYLMMYFSYIRVRIFQFNSGSADNHPTA